MRTKPKVKDRAFQILKEKGPDAAATAIAAILSDEGYGDINPVTIRAWKSRYNWDIGLPEIIEKITISPNQNRHAAAR